MIKKKWSTTTLLANSMETGTTQSHSILDKLLRQLLRLFAMMVKKLVMLLKELQPSTRGQKVMAPS